MEEPGPPRLEVLWPYTPGSPRRVGLVSGSFDPMTVAHAALAEALTHSADLVLFLYASRTLPKEAGPGGEPGDPLLSPRDRVASLLAYCRVRPRVGVALCSHGLYVDQAEAARKAFPGADIVFGMGSDKVLQLVDPAWYGGGEPEREAALERLFSMARVVYAVRRGEEDRLGEALEEAKRWSGRLEPLAFPPELTALSSRQIREEIARGAHVAEVVPPEVMPFLERGFR
jgi:nicotinic acid mononucleotide adenylyltransferase